MCINTFADSNSASAPRVWHTAACTEALTTRWPPSKWLSMVESKKIMFFKQTKLEGRKEMFYLTTHSTHYIYSYMASDIWLRTILIVRKETRCRHMVYSYRLAARVILYAPSHRQDSTYHGLCYTSHGALAGTRNSSITPWRIDPTTHRTMSERSYQN